MAVLWQNVRLALVVVTFVIAGHSQAMSPEERTTMKEQVLEMFRHGHNSYMKHAYPADELMPLSCRGRVRGVEPSRGDIDDALGGFSLTLIDTLDSLALLGELEEFERVVRLVIRDVSFDNDVVVSVFETNIRVLGGLLGGHVAAVALKSSGQWMQWYQGELLDMAKDIGHRLLPAFNTTTGIPYPRVNLKYGIHHPSSNTGSESDTCTACGGTMIMEFGALSRLTGDPIFEQKASKAMEAIWVFRSRASDLVGTVINIHNGDWVRRDSGVGAGIDSYYEYCLKAYILFGDQTYLQRFNKHYKSIMQYINKGPMLLSVQMHQPERTAHSYMDSLLAFWPGLQVLKGDLKKAIETHQMLYEVSKRHTFLPEAFTPDFEVHWGQHPLRPEFAESTYFLYQATRDPYYLDVGKSIVEKIDKHARMPCGFAALKDVRTLLHEDKMDSFVLSETFKYLFLLFSDSEDLILDVNKFVFTTEAHLLPLSLSTISLNSSAYEVRYNVTLNPDNEYEYTCAYTGHTEGGRVKFAEDIRRETLPQAQGSCPKKQPVHAYSADRPSRMRAEQFEPGNKDHIATLKSMGVNVVQTKDGRIQLIHTASSAYTQAGAEDGIKFMQEMIELAKQRNEDSAVHENPRVVQLMSSPYDGSVILNAGPAQFGLDLTRGDVGVGAEVIFAEPVKGCSTPANADDLRHRIVAMERGDCMFIDKARHAEAAGAVGVIIIDTTEGSSSTTQPFFAMAGDGTTNDVRIPAVMLFNEEGLVLRRALASLEDTGRSLHIRLASKAHAKGKSQGTTRDPSGTPEGEQEGEGLSPEETAELNSSGGEQRRDEQGDGSGQADAGSEAELNEQHVVRSTGHARDTSGHQESHVIEEAAHDQRGETAGEQSSEQQADLNASDTPESAAGKKQSSDEQAGEGAGLQEGEEDGEARVSEETGDRQDGDSAPHEEERDIRNDFGLPDSRQEYEESRGNERQQASEEVAEDGLETADTGHDHDTKISEDADRSDEESRGEEQQQASGEMPEERLGTHDHDTKIPEDPDRSDEESLGEEQQQASGEMPEEGLGPVETGHDHDTNNSEDPNGSNDSRV